MSKERKKPTDQEWEDLPKSRVIFLEHVSNYNPDPSPTSKDILLQSLTSKFNFPSEAIPNGRILIHKSVSNKHFSFYNLTTRDTHTTWKGINSYVPAKLLLHIQHSGEPISWILSRISKDPRIFSATGVYLIYDLLPENHIRVDFYLTHNRLVDSIVDFLPRMAETFKYKGQIVLKEIIESDKMTSDVDTEISEDPCIMEQRRKADLDFESFFDLFEKFRKRYADPVPNYKINTDNLNCRLMPYQKETVRWMMHREAETTIDQNLSWLMKCEKLPSDPSHFYYPVCGAITRKQLNYDEQYELAKRFTLKGGILADEMGLGKTVQVLSLISTHKRSDNLEIEDGTSEVNEDNNQTHTPNYSVAEQVRIAELSYTEMKNARQGSALIKYNVTEFTEGSTIICTSCSQMCSPAVCGWNVEDCKDEPFYCPDCLTNSVHRRPIKTTLIILPESLIFQWFTEVGKHCSDNIKVMFYFGIKKHGYIQPYEMASYDVILTTYDTLRSEINFAEPNVQRRNLRNESKPLFVTSPLTHVKFWRLVVDESQVMPQGINSQLTKMLWRMRADNWWCVTGTPLVKAVSDIGPLFTFLDLFPFGHPDFFSQYVHSQYINHFSKFLDYDLKVSDQNLPQIFLLEMLGRIMSRKTKEDVELQINLPELTEIEKRITFSEVEERQYKDEKERLKGVVQRSIGRAVDHERLSNLPCRDKVLQELRTLRETVLTGQNNSSDLGAGGYVYAPETVVFRLFHNKKLTIMNTFRNFLTFGLGLAGVQLLMQKPENALPIYKHALESYQEILGTETDIEDILGQENILKLKGTTSSPSVSPRSFDDLDGEDGDVENILEEDIVTKTQEELARMQEVAGLLKGIKQLCKKYTKSKDPNLEDSAECLETTQKVHESSRDDDDLPGPSEPKRARIESEKEQNDVNCIKEEDTEKNPESSDILETSSDERDQLERQIHFRKMALSAFKPIKMDGTQELHLLMNMNQIQEFMGVPEEERVSLDRLIPVLKHYIKLELQAAKIIRAELPTISGIWEYDEKNMLYEIGQFFEMMRARCAVKQDTSALYEYGKEVRDLVKKEHFPNLPFVALYDTEKLKPKHIHHHGKRCMGRCAKDVMECEQFIGQPCLSLAKIVEKTMEQFKKIDEKRKEVEEQLNNFMELILEMADPNVLLVLLTKTRDDKTDENEKMLNVIFCEHKIYKGIRDQTESMDQYYTKPHPCALCDMWSKLTSLHFDSGFSSYHGQLRQNSGVFEFASLLVHHFAPGKREALLFAKHYLRPFFERIQDILKAFRLTTSMLVDLVDRFHELSQAKSLLTDEQVCAYFRQGDFLETIEEKRKEYADSYLAQRENSMAIVRKNIKELRYLSNLMKKQLNDEKDEEQFEECPICRTQMNSFMVFPCGHRICQECFDRLKAISRREIGHPPDTIICPSCRVRNNTKQVMLARSGHAEKDSVIPGVILSAKLSTAIGLIREILDTDDSNKIILFTSVEPSSTNVWNYLLRILKLAKLPYTATTRGTCGKSVVDFEVSDNIKILLCSLSLCANGLNMTGANHIIFLDPPHLQSVLHQAIGRINRFGQRRAMRVFHLVVEGSLDAELRETAKKTNRREDEKKGWTIGDIRGMFDIQPHVPMLGPDFADHFALHFDGPIRNDGAPFDPIYEDRMIDERLLRLGQQLHEIQQAAILRRARRWPD